MAIIATPSLDQPMTKSLSTIVIRPIRRNDLLLICEMHQRLSAETVYFRYLQYKIPSLDELEAVCNITPQKGAALVATINSDNGRKERERIVALAYYIGDPVQTQIGENVPVAEVAILVEDQFQGQGVGRMLWQAIHEHAQNEQIHSLRVLFDLANYRMLRMIKGSGYPYLASAQGDLNDFLILLQAQPQLSKVQQLLERFGRPILQRLVTNKVESGVGSTSMFKKRDVL